jgi:hypothetical protein
VPLRWSASPEGNQEQQNAAGKEEKARSRLSFHHEDITLLFALSLRSRKANRVICKSIGETTVVQEGMDSMPTKTAQPDRRAHWVNTSGRNRKGRAASKANGAVKRLAPFAPLIFPEW